MICPSCKKSGPASFKCRNCGAELPAGSRYCPQCGRASTDGTTELLDLPTDETGSVPVNYARTEPRYYGVTPATTLHR